MLDSSEWRDMPDDECGSGGGGSERSEESDCALRVPGGPSISCESFPLRQESWNSFSLSCMTLWTGVAPLEPLVLVDRRVPSAVPVPASDLMLRESSLFLSP